MPEMDLPIDLIPNTRPARFRWRRVVDTLVGVKVVHHEGMLPPNIEGEVVDLIALVKRTIKERDDLLRFKNWVHAYLDARGVPKEFPDGEHTKCGCRIGDRMDWLMAQLEEAQGKTGETPTAEPVNTPTGKRKGK